MCEIELLEGTSGKISIPILLCRCSKLLPDIGTTFSAHTRFALEPTPRLNVTGCPSERVLRFWLPLPCM